MSSVSLYSLRRQYVPTARNAGQPKDVTGERADIGQPLSERFGGRESRAAKRSFEGYLTLRNSDEWFIIAKISDAEQGSFIQYNESKGWSGFFYTKWLICERI